jgi:hypothetical protein
MDDKRIPLLVSTFYLFRPQITRPTVVNSLGNDLLLLPLTRSSNKTNDFRAFWGIFRLGIVFS